MCEVLILDVYYLISTKTLIVNRFLFFPDIYSFFVCVVILVSFANGAPQNHHRHGHQSWTSVVDDDSDSKMGWVNPCGGEFLATAPTKFENETGLRPRNVSLFSYNSNKYFRQIVLAFILICSSIFFLCTNFDFSIVFTAESFKAIERSLTEFHCSTERT